MIAVLSGNKEEFIQWMRYMVRIGKIHVAEIGNYHCICDRADHIGMVFSEVRTIGTALENANFDSNFIEEIQLQSKCLKVA